MMSFLSKYRFFRKLFNISVTRRSFGDWDDPDTWQDGRVPDDKSIVFIRHHIVLNKHK